MMEVWTLVLTTFAPTWPTLVEQSSGTPPRSVEVESVWPPDRPNYAHFKSSGGATFAVMEAEGRGARFNFTVDDADALWIELKDKVAVVEPLFDTPYGTRKFTIADPGRNSLWRHSGTLAHCDCPAREPVDESTGALRLPRGFALSRA